MHKNRLAVGAIISGCYIGDRISPISDMSNLVAGVSEADVIEYVKSAIPLNLVCMGIIGIIYGLIGMRYASSSDLTAQVGQISGLLAKEFSVSIWNFLPLLLLVGGILLKLPAIPSIVIGILAGGVMAVFVQGYSVAEVLDSCFYGYVSESGAETIDNLLTAGGIDSMQYSLTLALSALMFGGVMDKTGLMNAFMDPIIQKLRRRGDISAAVVVSTLAVNVIIPDNYVAIALPGSMFKKVYKKEGMPLKELARALGGGACSTSVLIPWNTCGIYMSTVLGVKTVQYMPFVFLNMLVIVVTILLGYFSRESAAKQEAPHTKEP